MSNLRDSLTMREKITSNMWRGSNKLLPFLPWIRNYSRSSAAADLINGVTIGLIIIPQSVAYVALVGLSAKVGLLSAAIGGIVYTFLGTVKEVSIGPTAMMSLLTNEYIREMPVQVLSTFCFGCAVVGFVLSIFRLGLVVEFISIPVSSAFGSTVGLTIVAQELRSLMGLHYKSNTFVEHLTQFFRHVTEANPPDFILGTASMTSLILIDKVKNIPVSQSWERKNAVKKTFWLISLSKSAITLLLACLLTKYFETYHGFVPYTLSDPVTPGLPDYDLPWLDTKVKNVTITFPEKISKLYPGMLIIPIVALLVHVSIAKFFDNSSNVGIGHELLTISLSNILCAFFNSSPVAGAFSRSAVSSVCEVQTPISNIYASILSLLALSLLTPYFRLIPRPTLSAVIVTAICSVIDYKIVLTLWKHSKKDLFVLLCTLASGLLYGIEFGLIGGVLVNLLFLVYLWARPMIDMTKSQCKYGEYVLVTPNLGLFYPAVNHLEKQMYKTLRKDQFKDLPIAVNCMFLKGFDYTAAKGLARIIKAFRKQEREIVFFNTSDKIFHMCVEIDASVLDYFYKDEERCQSRLFNLLHLNPTTLNKIIHEDAKGMNGHSSQALAKKSVPEELRLLNAQTQRERHCSL